MKRQTFNLLSDFIIATFGLKRPSRIYRAFIDRMDCVKQVEINGSKLLFDANAELHLLRAEWLNQKEPETLRWIDTFDEGDVFYDVGANLGVFSVYAAVRRRCQVFAFEPEAKNYACLNRNLFLNGLSEQARALNIALYDQTRLEYLRLHDLSSGAALHSVGEAKDWRGNRFDSKFDQAVLAFALDELIDRFEFPAPNHIKLDVDGGEQRIIQGGRRTFSDKRLKSIQVELNQKDVELIALIENCGLRLSSQTVLGMQGEGDSFVNAVFRRI